MNDPSHDRPQGGDSITCPVCAARQSFAPFYAWERLTLCPRCGIHIDTGAAANFAPYRTLAEWRREQNGLSDERVVDTIASVCRAMAVIHRRGMAHGELCPSLVYLDADGDVRFARRVGGTPLAHDLESPGLVTTPAELATELLWCLAPERFIESAASPDPTADVYSLGILLWYGVAGEWPPGSAPEILHRRFGGSPPEPAPLANGSLDAIYRKATQPNPDDRYRNAAEMDQALSRLND